MDCFPRGRFRRVCGLPPHVSASDSWSATRPTAVRPRRASWAVVVAAAAAWMGRKTRTMLPRARTEAEPRMRRREGRRRTSHPARPRRKGPPRRQRQARGKRARARAGQARQARQRQDAQRHRHLHPPPPLLPLLLLVTHRRHHPPPPPRRHRPPARPHLRLLARATSSACLPWTTD